MVIKRVTFRYVFMTALSVCLALTNALPSLCEGASPSIVFKDPNPKDMNFVYDGSGRFVDIYHRFYVNTNQNEEVYFKIAPEEGNDWYMNGIPEREEGWYVSFYIETGEGTPLQSDADGNSIEPFLGTRTDATPTPTVLLAPNTVYTLHLKVHVGAGLPYGIRSYGSVLVAIKRVNSGSGGSLDPSMELRVYMRPVNTYPISGVVYYKDKEHPAANATVILENKATKERIDGRTDSLGAYSFDLGDMKEGWHNGDTIVITAEYRGLIGSKEVNVDISEGRCRADILLKEEGGVEWGWGVIAITVILLGSAVGVYIYRRKTPSSSVEAGKSKKEGGKDKKGVKAVRAGGTSVARPSRQALNTRPRSRSAVTHRDRLAYRLSYTREQPQSICKRGGRVGGNTGMKGLQEWLHKGLRSHRKKH